MALRPPGLRHKHDMMATWGRHKNNQGAVLATAVD